MSGNANNHHRRSILWTVVAGVVIFTAFGVSALSFVRAGERGTDLQQIAKTNRSLINQIRAARRRSDYRLCREIKGINGRARASILRGPQGSAALLRLLGFSEDRIAGFIEAAEENARREAAKWVDVQCREVTAGEQ